MSYTIKHIASIINATGSIKLNSSIEYLLIDSRKIIFPNNSLFFALHSKRNNGHNFIKELYENGVRNFVIDSAIDLEHFEEANFLLVENSLEALQVLAAYHRRQYNIPVIGITGSNGKTIVKEWLYQLLSPDFNIVRSPRSYNSQIGVPLSVWQINTTHNLAIFEAGISTTNEMSLLQKIIQPTIGILTNIGNAHNEGFNSIEQKIAEKTQLFDHCKQLIFPKDAVITFAKNDSVEVFDWSKTQQAKISVKSVEKNSISSMLKFVFNHQTHTIRLPFIDEASIENCITCIATMLALNYNVNTIEQRIQLLQPLEMRMQLKKGINNCSILNDSYSNDISSLSIALDYLQQQSGNQHTTVILSDILQSGMPEDALYKQVLHQLQQRKINKLIAIGEQLYAHQHLFTKSFSQTAFYPTVQAFLANTTTQQFKDEFILLKGARIFSFEAISKWLEQKVHQTVMEINLTAMAHNLKIYQNFLQPTTKLMAMVKAFSYGSGNAEVARLLQFNNIDYLAVAYADEGIDLRRAGITLPIMVMNADEATFDALIEFNLEPELYSFYIYHNFHKYLLQQAIAQFPVHIKLNTGMNRLGFDEAEVTTLALLLAKNNTLVVKTVFSHFTSSENPEHDVFTTQQANSFQQSCQILETTLGYHFIKHIANTAGIFRHPNFQMDMVRLGIGLYGVDSVQSTNTILQTVATLKTTIAQIRTVKAGETVGYNKKGIVTKESKIATIRIGYADGFSRKLSNGIGSVFIKHQLAKVVGNVCMDMTMIDVTHIANVTEGDEVEIFGNNLLVQQLADWCGTISYEIMTGINQRVKRIYIEE